jgi:uncharacterized protein YciI
MSRIRISAAALAALLVSASASAAQGAPAQAAPDKPAAAPAKAAFDQALATKVGADDYGMRNYVLVILKTGPTRVPDGAERTEMFRGHLANINRLSAAGKMAVAGPFSGEMPGGWRGLFVLAVADVEEAKQLVATDPVIVKGEMVAEYHKWYGSAALMLVPDAHPTVAKKSF